MPRRLLALTEEADHAVTEVPVGPERLGHRAAELACAGHEHAHGDDDLRALGVVTADERRLLHRGVLH